MVRNERKHLREQAPKTHQANPTKPSSNTSVKLPNKKSLPMALKQGLILYFNFDKKESKKVSDGLTQDGSFHSEFIAYKSPGKTKIYDGLTQGGIPP